MTQTLLVRLRMLNRWVAVVVGIMMIVLVEMALITPPVGLNLYVVQGARKNGAMNEVMVGAIPYVLAMLAMVVALILFPEIALFLPQALE